ncbi:uncharacterized protein LOC113232631 [Hyposmocoma kahamanoa]|uniref:uncharacterized protein LOC113232631 n=1 Tax=Hyposmocoma kahamanoa TaxID=1477025 RepID=UPI000E6D7F87|nr:uncharacterized protein LOC113232631 [Hyposmocoma kahamanoa]XP_026323197.1 uncharacterized protein LOC113232631 [Hyposmocoma kahamanoa]
MKVFEVNSCCFCCPLRWGILLFGYINMAFSMLAAFTLAVEIEIRERSGRTAVELTGAFLFAIFGMSVILSILLVYATYEKDRVMLRLYNIYAVATAMATVIPLALLLYMHEYFAATVAFLGIVLQSYVIILVRSEVLNLEKIARRKNVEPPFPEDGLVDIPDRELLI